MKIPFSLPYIGSEEREAVMHAVEQEVLHGDGPISRRVQQKLREWLDVKHVFLTTSCTHAIEMAMIALGIGPGDEVIMPSFTFVSSANAAVLRGARPVFAEILSGTLNIDPDDVERKMTPQTKAIVPMHYAGVGCDMDAIMSIARRHGVYVIEDAAQGVDAYYKGKALGTIGDIGCFSFHDTKNITCGEGGAFLTDSDDIAHKAELVREKGTNRSAFFRGEVDKYSWVAEGSSYIQSDILAAILEVQLTRRDEIREKRRRVWEAYYDALKPLADAGHVWLPDIPAECRSNYHIFWFRVDTPDRRDAMLEALRGDGIQATFHYVPLHSSPFCRKVLGMNIEMAITRRCSETLVRLPVYPQLLEQIGSITATISRIVSQLATDAAVGAD